MLFFSAILFLSIYYIYNNSLTLWSYYQSGETFGTEQWVLLAVVIGFFPVVIYAARNLILESRKSKKKQEEEERERAKLLAEKHRSRYELEESAESVQQEPEETPEDEDTFAFGESRKS